MNVCKITLLVVLACAMVQAQDPISNFSDEGGHSKPGWSFKAGAMAMTGPAIPGSDTERNIAMPMLSAEYDGRYFFGSSRVSVGAGLGMHLLKSRSFTWDLGLGYSERRVEDRADELAGMGDRTAAIWVGTAMKYRLGPLSAGLTLATGMRSEVGSRSTLELAYRTRIAEHWFAGMTASAVFGDAKNLSYDFGVSEEQSARRQGLLASGDSRLKTGEGASYTPGAGLRELQAGIFAGFSPDRSLRYFLMLRGTKLQGDAASSPLVRKPETLSAGFGFTYQF
ncbi:MAG: MipA/OmpV family protein [Holophagaceae bacterium]|nr:MipA/OmpV family protein [Holophagaceae bacterium]